MIINETFNTALNSPFRALRGRVEIYEGDELILICGCHDNLISYDIERIGENKFFGYGVCQKINVKLIDKERKLNISTANSIEVVFGLGNDYIYPFPRFYVTEVHRNENDNTISITAYDALYGASAHTVADLGNIKYYTLNQYLAAFANLLGLPLNELGAQFDIDYPNGANFDGTETIREALNAIAEATQTIYYINWDWKLTFKSLLPSDAAAFTIDREKYITLDSGDNRRLSKLIHTTELGDNVSATTDYSGSTQYLRDNPFLNMRDDVGVLLESAINRVGGLTINQFNCEWRGNFLVEIGDKLELITKDNNSIYSYLLNDTVSFNGSLSQISQWSFDNDEAETESNPVSLGDALKQTIARVDKANQQIDLAVSTTTEAIGAINNELEEINRKVGLTVTKDNVEIMISEAVGNGANKVETTTGFTFDDNGLTVSKSSSDISTTITEDGMTVQKGGDDVLTANNEGVKAIDLHATTYLVIGKNSRFEDFEGDRTACFWIGG